MLQRLLPPLAAGLLVAVTQAICLALAWFLARASEPRPLVAAAATLAAIIGPVTLSELGTSFSDLLLAALPLASILLVLWPPRRGARTALLLAGLLTGLAAAGIRFSDLNTEQSSLEDIFVGLVREGTANA